MSKLLKEWNKLAFKKGNQSINEMYDDGLGNYEGEAGYSEMEADVSDVAGEIVMTMWSNLTDEENNSPTPPSLERFTQIVNSWGNPEDSAYIDEAYAQFCKEW